MVSSMEGIEKNVPSDAKKTTSSKETKILSKIYFVLNSNNRPENIKFQKGTQKQRKLKELLVFTNTTKY